MHERHVDDLVQDVFVRMQEHASELRDDERLASWALRIAHNVVVDHHRKSKELPTAEVPEAEESPDGRNLNALVAVWLVPMLALLPDEYAEALEAVELLGLSQKAYAERSGLSFSGAKSRVQRARKMLEGVLRACCDLEHDAHGNVIAATRRADGSDAGEPR